MEQKIYSYVLHIAKGNMKVPIEDFSLMPENSLGSHILRDSGHVGKITINICHPKKKYDFTVSDDPKDVFKVSSFYNLAASLGKCFIHHSFERSDANESALSLTVKFVVTDTMAIELLDKYQKRLEVVEPKNL